MFMPQIAPKQLADVPFIEAGKLILTGYFFKLFVANNLNEMTAYMEFPLSQTLQTQDRWLLVFLYSYQIYADFFGYSAIAIGLGLLFGYRLPINFNLPYVSQSFSEFWTAENKIPSLWCEDRIQHPAAVTGAERCGPNLNPIIVMGLGGPGTAHAIYAVDKGHGAFLRWNGPSRPANRSISAPNSPDDRRFRLCNLLWIPSSSRTSITPCVLTGMFTPSNPN